MYIQTLKTKFRFSVDGKPEVRKKVKEYLDKNRIKYAYFCRIKMFSVDIAAKDQIMQLLKTLKLFIQGSIQKPDKQHLQIL